MSNFKLNLPVDIPWKRKCVTSDMVDKNVGDNVYPHRWQSSIVVFEYEPPDEYQTYPDSTVSYLKVVCSITGYQLDRQDRLIEENSFDIIGTNAVEIENYKDILATYYPCYGAILEVSVGPSNNAVSVDKYPYFVDFEPKKRELYEMVSETGEMSSMSSKDVFVGKNNSSLTSKEVLNVFQGANLNLGESKGVNVAGTGMQSSSSFGAGVQGQWGTIDRSENQEVTVKNTNKSQEARETQSHTTQLTQMYHQLDSYHLGTNRALFFINPRPHVVQNKYTFVNGPKQLEGIQEFLLVVMRPKDVLGICVEATLETAHLNMYERGIQEKTELKVEEFKNTKENYEKRVYTWEYKPPIGYEIDLSKTDDGYSGMDMKIIDSDGLFDRDKHLIRIIKTKNDIKFEFTVEDQNVNQSYPIPSMKLIKGMVKFEAVIYLKIRTENTLFLVGRKCNSCNPRSRLELPTLVYEIPFDPEVVRAQILNSPINIANELGIRIKENIVKSLNSPRRYELGKVKVLQSNFASKRKLQVLESMKKKDVLAKEKIEKYADSILGQEKEKIKRILNSFPPEKIINIFSDPAFKIAKDFNLQIDEVQLARNVLSNFLTMKQQH